MKKSTFAIACLVFGLVSFAFGNDEEYFTLERSMGNPIGGFNRGADLWTPKNAVKKYWNVDDDYVEFVDCLGGQVGFVGSYSLYNCYLPKLRISKKGNPVVTGFQRFYVHIFGVGFTAAWARHSLRMKCRYKNIENLENNFIVQKECSFL